MFKTSSIGGNVNRCCKKGIFNIANQPIRPMFHSKTIARAELFTEHL
jgi:hypothetical protein